MKTLIAVMAVILLPVKPASAIPQTVGAGFLNAAGMSFEQYVGAVATWAPDAELKGPWHRRGTEPDKAGAVVTYDLAVAATVFGLPAAQISAERKDGMLLRFTVRFDESKLKNGKVRGGTLLDQVLAGIRALASEAKAVSPSGERTFRHEASRITARKGDRKGVVVEFAPAR